LRSSVLKLALEGTLTCLALSVALSPTGLAHSAASSPASPHMSLRPLVLTAKDLPNSKAWHQTAGVQPNQAVALAERVTLATINRYRITGYGTSLFRRSRGRGLVSIGDSVGLYKNVAAATWQYAKFTSINKQPAGTKRLTMTGIGDQARGYSASTSHFGIASVYFRRGIFTARLDVTSLGPMDIGAVLHLTRVLDQRLKHAH
jgi:hypothetical protein